MMTCIKGKCSRVASHKMIQMAKCMKKALYGNFESSVDIFESLGDFECFESFSDEDFSFWKAFDGSVNDKARESRIEEN